MLNAGDMMEEDTEAEPASTRRESFTQCVFGGGSESHALLTTVSCLTTVV